MYKRQAEKYTKVSREYIFLGLVGVLCVYLVIGFGAGLVVNLLGFVYPAYKSCKAIDSEEKDDDTQWLTYWVVYAAFGIVEYFTDIILSWVPFYFLAKCAFLIWCMVPVANNGSMFIYHRFIKRFVKEHEKDFEDAISAGTQLAREAGKKATEAVKGVAGKVTVGDLQKIQETLSDETEKKEQ